MCSIKDHVTLLRKLIVGVVHQPGQGEGCDQDGGHAQQALLYHLVILLRLGDFYLREEVDGY